MPMTCLPSDASTNPRLTFYIGSGPKRFRSSYLHLPVDVDLHPPSAWQALKHEAPCGHMELLSILSPRSRCPTPPRALVLENGLPRIHCEDVMMPSRIAYSSTLTSQLFTNIRGGQRTMKNCSCPQLTWIFQSGDSENSNCSAMHFGHGGRFQEPVNSTKSHGCIA